MEKHEPTSHSRRLSRSIGILMLFVLYFFTARFGLKLSAVSGFAALVWPPTGISLAALLIFGEDLWPGVALGAFFVNWSVGAQIPVAMGICAGNTIEAILAVHLLRRIGFEKSLESLKDVIGLILFAAFFSAFISATIGTASLLLGGTVSHETFRATWLAWWFGDMMGDLVIAPVLLVWGTGIRFSKKSWQIFESAALMTLVLFGQIFIFTDWIAEGPSHLVRPFLIFPIMMVIAIRLGQKGVVTALLTMAIIVLVATASGNGRFWTGNLTDSLLQAQIFLGVVAISEMVLAATITERKKERDALSASNAQREAILNASLDAIVTIDHQGLVVEFNPAAEKTFGYQRKDVIGKEMASLIIPPRLRDAHRHGLAQYLVTNNGPVLGKKLELPAIRSDGTEFPTELSIVPLKTTGHTLFTGFIQDITEQKQAEAEKRRREQAEIFLAEATEKLFESIDYSSTLKHIVQTPLSRFADCSTIHVLDEETKRPREVEWACSIPEKAVTLQEYINSHLSNIREPTTTSVIFETRKPHLVTHVSDEDYRRVAKNDVHLSLLRNLGLKSLLAVPLFLRGKPLGLITVASLDRHYDFADVEIMEELARRAATAIENARLYHESQEAIMARDEFLSVASHELRTPLTSLSLQLQIFNRILQKSLHDSEQDAEMVTIPMRIAKSIGGVETQSRKLAALLDELLDLTRIRLGRLQLERESMDLAALVNESVERFRAEAAQNGVAISTQIVKSAVGQWDRMRMEQVVSNLISNAIKYGEGKPVSIGVEQDESRRWARLTVRDHGMGISPEMQERIFQRFERAGISGKKIAGLGLGLYITRQIVEAHGGTIRVESEVGKGSTFTVEIPLFTRDA